MYQILLSLQFNSHFLQIATELKVENVNITIIVKQSMTNSHGRWAKQQGVKHGIPYCGFSGHGGGCGCYHKGLPIPTPCHSVFWCICLINAFLIIASSVTKSMKGSSFMNGVPMVPWYNGTTWNTTCIHPSRYLIVSCSPVWSLFFRCGVESITLGRSLGPGARS